MGHYCRICGRDRPNEKFSGKGHRAHVCRDCYRLPKEEFERIEVDEELWGFVEQSNIAVKNRKRLEVLMKHSSAEIRDLAELLMRVSVVAPRKKKRWQKVMEVDPELYVACEKMGWTEYPY